MSAIFFLGPQNVLLHSGRQTIHAPTNLSGVGTSTSSVFTGLGLTSVTVTMNVTGAVTGTSPNLVLTLEELDPGDLTTILQTVSASAMTATLQNRTLRMSLKYGDAVRVKWALTGTTPVFNGVYTTFTAGIVSPAVGPQVSANAAPVALATDQVPNLIGQAWFNKITDGTNTAAVKPSGVIPNGTDPALVVTMSPNATTFIDGPVSQGAAAALLSAWPIKLSDGVSAAAVKAASTTAVAADPALVVTMSPNSVSEPVSELTASATFTAVNDVVTIAVNGRSFVGFQIPSGFVGTAAPQFSYNGGVTWGAGLALSPMTGGFSTSITISGQTHRTILVPGGATHVRVIVSVATSGSATATLRANTSGMLHWLPQLPLTIGQLNQIASLSVTMASNDPLVSEVQGGNFLNALNQTVSSFLYGKRSIGAFIASGSFVGTIVPEYLFANDSTWNTASFVDPSTGTLSTSLVLSGPATSVSRAIVVPVGASQARIRISAYTSGIAAFYVSHSNVDANPLPPGTSLIGSVKLSDGTNTGVLKAASTAALATDPALVVAISPNNTVPVSAASLPLPTNAAQEHITAANPHSVRFSTGAAFYDGTKTGQLPTALGATTAVGSVSFTHATDDWNITDWVGFAISLGALNTSVGQATLKGKRSAGFVLTGGGTLVGTLTPECFVGTAYEASSFFDPLTGASSATLTVGSPATDIVRGIMMFPGTTNVRVRVSAYTSGASTGVVTHSNVDPTLGLLAVLATASSAATPAGTNTIGSVKVTDGTNLMPTADVAARAQFTKTTDGTNIAAVKPASTAPAATDPALVVSLSQNTPGVKVWDGTNVMPTADVAARAQFTKTTDGTNVAAVKAASTAAVAADPALVVAVSPNNTVPTRPGLAGTATLTNVPASATSVQILASNTNRLRAYVYNDSSIAMVLKYGTTASLTSLTTIVQPNTAWPVDDGYTGRIDAIWASATGNARATELTA